MSVNQIMEGSYIIIWGVTRKDNSEGEFSQWVEFQAVHLTAPLLWKEKGSDIRIYYRLMSSGKWLVWLVGTQKEKRQKGLGEDHWSGAMWIDIFEWAQCVKVLVSHFNIHQEVSIMKETLNNQSDKMNWSVAFDQLAFDVSHPKTGMWTQRSRKWGYTWT